jgi:hypothetical protein
MTSPGGWPPKGREDLDGGALVRTDTQACAGCPDQHFCRFPAIDHRKDMERFPSPEKHLARS